MSTLVIPAAGLASRLRPISNNTSKCMVSVNGKPIIAYILEQVGHLFDEIILVYGKNDDAVKFCSTRFPNLPIAFVKQEEAIGPLHAVWCAIEKARIGDQLTIWLGDTIVTDYLPSNKNEIVAHKVPDWNRWCMVDKRGILFDKPEEKPPTDLALVGIYTFENGQTAKRIIDDIIFSGTKVRGEFQISQLIGLYGGMSVVETNEWFDCGDLPSLYDSSARLLKKFACRPDSSVEIDTIACTFTKSGDRCKNEIHWYKSIPPRVKPFVPAVYGVGDNSYTMELLTGTTVADMLLFEDLTTDGVSFIIRRCLDSYKTAFLGSGFIVPIDHNDHMLYEKNLNRVIQYDAHRSEIGKYTEYVKNVANRFRLKRVTAIAPCHGDFHLGNIIFSPENGRVKFIDPRGNWCGDESIVGYAEYDLIKFAQSIFGNYIWIYAGMEVNHKVREAAIGTFVSWCKEEGFDVEFIFSCVPIMLGSILEFHTDSPDRQRRIWQETMSMIP